MVEMKNQIRDFVVMTVVLALSFGLTISIQNFLDTEAIAPVIFVLAVFIVAMGTDGYKWGILAAFLSVLAVNFAFTFPYFEFSVSMPENIFSGIVMLLVAAMTSALATKTKRQEELRREAEKEKVRADLLRAVSHDIRTPLTTIYGAGSAVMENYDLLSKEQQMKMLKGICEESEWLIRMVENLLSVTRLDGGNVSVIKTPVPLEELIDSVLMKFRKRYPGVEPEVSMLEDFISIPMDALLIEQVLLNLMENSVRHAKGMTRLILSVKVEDEKAVFQVSDNGSGIDEGKIGALVGEDGRYGERYGDAGRTNSGIGLSVCAAIIKAHDGTIEAESGERGATVRFFLKMEDLQDEQ